MIGGEVIIVMMVENENMTELRKHSAPDVRHSLWEAATGMKHWRDGKGEGSGRWWGGGGGYWCH